MNIQEKIEKAKELIKTQKIEESIELLEDLKSEVYDGKKYNKCFENIKKEIVKILSIQLSNNFANDISLEIEKIVQNFYIINIIRKNNIDCYILEKKINDFYKTLSNIIQKLNVENKRKRVVSLFRKIYKYIPSKDIKFKNIILNEYEIAKSKKQLKSYPRILQIVITTKCNLKCIMCGKHNHDGKYEISDIHVNNLKEVMPYLQQLILRGGEVFFSSAIDEIIQSAYKYKVKVFIITNGLLLNEENIYKIIKNDGGLIISIDSPFKKTYETIRVGAKFENLIYNINMINKIRRKINPKFALSINMVVMKQNYFEIEDMIKFASKYEFVNLSLSKIETDNSKEFIDYNIDDDIINKLSKKYFYFDQLAKKYKVNLFNKLPRKDIINKQESIISEQKRDLFCFTPWRSLFIDNMCRPHCNCNQFIYRSFLSNKKNLILFLWNSELLQKYRENISLNNKYKFCSEQCLQNPLINDPENRVIEY